MGITNAGKAKIISLVVVMLFVLTVAAFAANETIFSGSGQHETLPAPAEQAQEVHTQGRSDGTHPQPPAREDVPPAPADQAPQEDTPNPSAEEPPVEETPTEESGDHITGDVVAEMPEEQVTICHVPPGNPENARTIAVAASDVDAHLAHGDYVGDCRAPEETQPVPPSDVPLEEETPVAQPPPEAPVDEEVIEAPLEEEPALPTEEQIIPTKVITFLQLVLDKLSVIAGELVKITAILKYENQSPVGNAVVDFTANDEAIGSKTTDEAGVAELPWDTSLVVGGDYIIRASYAGSEGTEASADRVTLAVEPAVVEQLAKEEYMQLISNTEACTDRCETVYRITPHDAPGESFDLNFKNREGAAEKGIENGNAKSELQSSGYRVKNLRVEFSEDGKTWEKFTPGKINQVGESFELRITGQIGQGDWVDNIISFAGFTYDEYAVWNGQQPASRAKEDYVQLVENTYHCIDNCRTVYRICRYDAAGASFDLNFKGRDSASVKSVFRTGFKPVV